jgi:hypothetical protein
MREEKLVRSGPCIARCIACWTSPVYGGAYTHGKTEQLVRYDSGKPRHPCRRKPREQWLALIPGAHEGSVSWEEFERITPAIQENSSLAQQKMGKHC